jgi:asparagine synthase (glutamine-hydrolysing)
MDIKTFLPDDILVKVDRATMSHGLESRAPFLNHKLVEFAASLPVEYKMKGMRKKHLLKETMKAALPERVIEKRKQGFSAPVSSWLDGPLKSFANDVLSDPLLGEWFDIRYIERLHMEHTKRVKDNGYKLFGLVCFGIWLRQRKDSGKLQHTAASASLVS